MLKRFKEKSIEAVVSELAIHTVLASTEHHHLSFPYGWTEQGGAYSLILERYPKDLETAKKAANEAVREDWCAQLCDVLSLLHAMRIKHNDVALRNVMIDDHGRAVLIDFGQSTIFSDSKSLSAVSDSQPTVNSTDLDGFIVLMRLLLPVNNARRAAVERDYKTTGDRMTINDIGKHFGLVGARSYVNSYQHLEYTSEYALTLAPHQIELVRWMLERSTLVPKKLVALLSCVLGRYCEYADFQKWLSEKVGPQQCTALGAAAASFGNGLAKLLNPHDPRFR